MASSDLQSKLAVAKTAQERGEALDQRGAPASVMGFLSDPRTKKQIARLLGTEEMADRWLRIGLTEVKRIVGAENRSNGLGDCTLESFAGALMQCAMLRLEPGPPLGLAWILPYENRVKVRGQWTTRMDAQFQLGYPGIVQLAHRSGQLATIAAHEVCEQDEFAFDYLTGERRHRPPYRGERGKAYGYYCYARYANGGEHFLYMTREQVEAHAKRFSKAYQYDLKRIEDSGQGISPWTKDFDPMARKTLVKLSRPFLPASADFVQALQADDRVVTLQGDKLVIDDEAVELALSPPQEAEEQPEGTAEQSSPSTDAAAAKGGGLPGIGTDG